MQDQSISQNTRRCDDTSDAGVGVDLSRDASTNEIGEEQRLPSVIEESRSAVGLSPPARHKRPKRVKLDNQNTEKQNQDGINKNDIHIDLNRCEPEAKELNNACNDVSIESRAIPKTPESPSRLTVNSRSFNGENWFNQTANRLSPFQRRFMDRMRSLKSEYITSDEARRKRYQRCNQVKSYLKAFLTHLFSTAGLCALTVGYSLLGALLFQNIEDEYYINAYTIVFNERQALAQSLWNITDFYNVLYPEKWRNETLLVLIEYERIIIKEVRDKGYSGVNTTEWSFSSSLLFAITVITTIGYGNITPHTWMGKLMTIFYAVIGIPIMLLCLTNLGNLMAKTFRFSYRKICCCFCCSKRSNSSQPQKVRTQIIELQDHANGVDKEDDSSVRLNKVSPDDNFDVNSIVTQQPSPRTPNSPFHRTQSVVVVETRDNISDNQRVPVWLVGLLVIGYIWGGGWMFYKFEQWDSLLTGAYFCFISLSTIGFGDFVPSKTVDVEAAEAGQETKGQLILIAVCIYLVFGLSLIAMSFNLVQEEILLKCRRIAQRIGIIAHD